MTAEDGLAGGERVTADPSRLEGYAGIDVRIADR